MYLSRWGTYRVNKFIIVKNSCLLQKFYGSPNIIFRKQRSHGMHAVYTVFVPWDGG